MEGPIQQKNKPLSCDALKSVIKSMSFEKRLEIHTNLPSLRAVNSVLPYTIETVWIRPNSLQINRKEWTFRKNSELSNSDNDDPNHTTSDDDDSNETTISIVDRDTYKRSPYFRVNKSFDEAFEKCFNVYLNGSIIEYLSIDHVPKFLCERNGSDGFKLIISSFNTDIGIVDNCIRFVNLDNLKHFRIAFPRMDNGEDFGILEKPEIINCKSLDLFVSVPETPPINYITGLRNQNLILNVNNFQVNELRMLIENWKTSDQPIGTSFYLFSFELNTRDIFDSLELQDTFPVEVEHDSIMYSGIGIKIDDNRDLVLYQGEHLLEEENAALKMEVIASRSKQKNGDSEPMES
ncbi:hypothetical protein CRE_17375 [Caenorhabditis remanei]|uniref:F-box associated domain-containing protein n=1 Tax=Caenorhabditis remanei TaxID=31234 RepID=E3N202_CAERE|nr:hypothetical protein CRE_17375 [Caenorhabditis remanei]